MTWKAGIDVLSFGATKNGAMTADAIVSFGPALATELALRAKRAGQLASKMRFHAAQIDAYLTDDLWLRNARQANAMATRLGDGLKAIPGTGLLAVPQANILFCRLPQHVTVFAVRGQPVRPAEMDRGPYETRFLLQVLPWLVVAERLPGERPEAALPSFVLVPLNSLIMRERGHV